MMSDFLLRKKSIILQFLKNTNEYVLATYLRYNLSGMAW